MDIFSNSSLFSRSISMFRSVTCAPGDNSRGNNIIATGESTDESYCEFQLAVRTILELGLLEVLEQVLVTRRRFVVCAGKQRVR